MELQIIQQKIFEIRGQKVMLDFDLAELYHVETKVFNQAVKRNIESFPEDFMFRLTKKEWQDLRSQIVTSSSQVDDPQNTNWSQIVTSRHGGARFLPYAFTEHGVTMLASVLKSPTARKMNIAIVRAFVALRKMAIQYKEIIASLDELKERMGGYDAQLNQIYEALETMLDKKVEEENKTELWKNRERIGFKK
ncbi:MAG: ORF6N domain-containing protein [Bacteroidetes bacterium]|nr:ORF6N domain-containing protein [Bacteroidota bacterium]